MWLDVVRAESRVFFTSGSAVEEEEEEYFAAACAASLPCEVSGHSQQAHSSSVVLPCNSVIGTSALTASVSCDTKDSLGQYLQLVLQWLNYFDLL